MIKSIALVGLLLLTPLTSQQRRQQVEVVKQPGAEERIPEVVAQHGDISLSYEPGEGRTLDQLLAESRVAVIGRIVSVEPRLSYNGFAILTDVRLAVEEVLHQDELAPSAKNKRLTFTVLGGRLQFPSGTATYETHLAFPITKGQRYLVLLAECRLEAPHDPPNALTPVGGPQGLFLIQGESLVPAASASFPISEQALGMSLAEFKSRLVPSR